MSLHNYMLRTIFIEKGCDSVRKTKLKCYGCKLYWECSVTKLYDQIYYLLLGLIEINEISKFRYYNAFYERKLRIEILK